MVKTTNMPMTTQATSLTWNSSPTRSRAASFMILVITRGKMICALSANLVFALAVQVFAYYSEKVSAIWMNWFKACVALVCFAAAVIIGGGTFDYSLKVSGMLFLSGVIGLAIGDLCLFAALKDLGPGRAMVLMAFHPLITGGLSYVFHGDVMAGYKIFAVIFMIAKKIPALPALLAGTLLGALFALI